MTITLPSPVWTPDDEDDEDPEVVDEPAVPTTHPYED